jgi:hypothetical protein
VLQAFVFHGIIVVLAPTSNAELGVTPLYRIPIGSIERRRNVIEAKPKTTIAANLSFTTSVLKINFFTNC